MQARPELVVVEGHQAGLRAVLLDNVQLLGRSRQCQVQLMEPYISRRQAEFRVTDDGWLIENLAVTPIRINGKKYGQNHKVYLETGDVITIGRQTKVLFVSAEDEPEAAVAAYRTKHPTPEPVEELPLPPLLAEKYHVPDALPASPVEVDLFSSAPAPEPTSPDRPLFGGGAPAPAAQSAPPVKGPQPPAVAPSVAPPAPAAPPASQPSATGSTPSMPAPAPMQAVGTPIGENAETPSPETTEQTPEDIAKRKKYTKYAIFGGVYAVALIGLFLFLGSLRGRDDDGNGPDAGTAVLSKTDIETIIDEPIDPKGNNSVTALENLVKARQFYTRRNSRRGNLYRCIQHYKLALAWGGEDGTVLLSVDDDEKFVDAKKQLLEKVHTTYYRAYADLREKDYLRATTGYNTLLETYPAGAGPEPNRDDVLFRNVQHYLKMAKSGRSP